MKRIVILLSFSFVGCQSTGGGNVTVSKSYPPGHCREVGQVIGTSNSREGSHAKAVADLRYEASLKDGDYVRVLAEAAHGAAIRGMAYRCR